LKNIKDLEYSTLENLIKLKDGYCYIREKIDSEYKHKNYEILIKNDVYSMETLDKYEISQ